MAKLSTLPVPQLIFADIEAGVLAYAKLPGLPLMEHPVAQPARLAAPWAGSSAACTRLPCRRWRSWWSGTPTRCWRGGRTPNETTERSWSGCPQQLAVEDFLGRTPPAEARAVAFCHNDLGGEHVLVDVEANALTGAIDWTDVAITDPVRDLALIYRDLGPEIFELTLAYYEGYCDDADRERAVFYARCKLLEDIAYGTRAGARRYAETGLAHLTPASRTPG